MAKSRWPRPRLKSFPRAATEVESGRLPDSPRVIGADGEKANSLVSANKSAAAAHDRIVVLVEKMLDLPYQPYGGEPVVTLAAWELRSYCH